MTRVIKLMLWIAVACLSGQSFGQGVRILEYVPDTSRRSDGAGRRLTILQAQKHVISSKVVKIDFAGFKSEWISLVLPDGNEIQIHKKPGSGFVTDSTNFGWVGEIRIGGGSALFSVHEGSLLGTIKLPTAYYSIEPLEDGLYTITRQKMGEVPPADPDSGPLKEPRSESRMSPLAESGPLAATSGEPIVVRVLIAYTVAAGSRVNGAVATRAILKLNEAFRASGVNVQAEIAGLLPLQLGESGLFSYDLETTRTLPELAKHRDYVSADVVITLVAKIPQSEELCGLAFFNPSADYAYGIVSAEYLDRDGDCFTHEIGHLFGADHHVAKASANSFPYGHGYQYTPPKSLNTINCVRTIMAYDFACAVGALVTVDNFSNPGVNIQFYNQQTGAKAFTVPSGDATFANNARVINEQASKVASFRGSSATSNPPGTPNAAAATAALIPIIIQLLYSDD